MTEFSRIDKSALEHYQRFVDRDGTFYYVPKAQIEEFLSDGTPISLALTHVRDLRDGGVQVVVSSVGRSLCDETQRFLDKRENYGSEASIKRVLAKMEKVSAK